MTTQDVLLKTFTSQDEQILKNFNFQDKHCILKKRSGQASFKID